jgi:ABC-type Fe3+/spermidine/putrescine transport system ATPase subunit
VARFIGDSNYVTGTLRQEGAGLVLDAAEHKYRLGPSPHVMPGECAALVIRPERLAVGGPSDEAPSMNHLDGIVRQVVYLGAFRMLEVDVPGVRVLRVREQVGAASSVREGDSVRLWWRPEESVVVPCDEVAAAGAGARIVG